MVIKNFTFLISFFIKETFSSNNPSYISPLTEESFNMNFISSG
ncbi:MAG: hypothetical protein ACP5OB_03875 [Candidatus Ratteibacteria bacterium]